MSLRDRVALITGASRGIGRRVAREMAREGARVIINYKSSDEAAKQTLDEIEQAGGRGELYKSDVSDYNMAQDMIEHMYKAYGKIDILVNNAGITRDNLLMKMSEGEFTDVIDSNLKSCFNCMQLVSRAMIKARYGRIINISSISGVMGNAGQVNYSASKAGIIGMTRSAAREMASRGITVNAIAPGFIETDMTAVLSEKIKESILASIPAKRFGLPEDIAHTAVFLAGDKAAYINGQVIGVNGGLL